MANILSKDNNLITIGKAAEILNISVDTLRRWDKKGIIRSQRINGKDRHYSIQEVEKLKSSKPLTMSQSAQLLKVSQSTLRRLDKKGLIKPEKNKNGERLYSKKVLEDFLHSEYFINKKKAQAEFFEPFREEKEDSKNTKEIGSTSANKILAGHEGKIQRHQLFWSILRSGILFITIFSILIILILTYLWLENPNQAAKYLGYRSKKPPVYGSAGRASGDSVISNSLAMIASYIGQPLYKTISYEIAKRIDPALTEYSPNGEKLIESAYIDINDNIVLLKPVVLESGQLKVVDEKQVKNLNSEYLQGRVPGENVGNLVIFGDDGEISGLKVQDNNLADGSVVGGLGGVILDGSITASDLANSTISDGKLTQITTANKVSGSAIQLAAGSGLVNNSGLSLLTSCSSNQVLSWDGSGWICSASGSSGVSSLNSTTGSLIIAGAGINSVGVSGSTITITGTEADTLATVTGRGSTTTTALTVGDITLSPNKALIVGSYSYDPGSPTRGTIFYYSTSNKL